MAHDDFLAQLDALEAEAAALAERLPSTPADAEAGVRLVHHLIDIGVIEGNDDLTALTIGLCLREYQRLQVRLSQAGRIIEKLRSGDLPERSRLALVGQLQWLDEEMSEKTQALEDIANYG